MTSNFDEFMRDFNDDVEEISRTTQTDAKEVMIETLRQIQMASPVHMGRFRASNQLGIDSRPTTESPDGLTKAEYYQLYLEELAKAKATLSPRKLKDGDKIYVTNNLAYAEALEEGHSKQAPLGIYAVTIDMMRRELS